jgi:Ulp1 family protease
MPSLHWLHNLIPGINLLGGHETNDSTSSHAEAQEHPARSESGGMDGAADRPSARGLEKRARESSEQRSPANKKQRTYSQEDGTYFGEYVKGVPEDRTKVMVPTSNDSFHQTRQAPINVMRAKPGAGHGHRTQNNIHAAQPGRAAIPRYKPANVTTGPKPTRQVAAQRKALDEDVGDGFNAQSKRRTPNGAPSTSKKQEQVVSISDDDDDDTFGTAQAVNGMSVHNGSSSVPFEIDSQSQPTTTYFAANEQRKVDQQLRSDQPRKRRRQSSGPNSVSVSSLVQPEHLTRPVSRSQDQPVGAESPARPSRPSVINTPAKAVVDKGKAPQRLPITLGKGVDDFDAESMKQRKDNHSVDVMNSSLNHIMRKPAKPTSTKGERSVNVVAEQPKWRQPSVPPASEQLRKQFVREQQTTPRQQQEPQQQIQRQRRPSLVKNMQTTSSNGNVNPIEESPDHLLGGNTALHRGQSTQRPRQILASSPTRQYSPSDLTPTNFIQSAQKPVRTMQPERTAARDAKSVEDDNLRISLEQIFSRGCVLDIMADGGPTSIELVYQGDRKEFLVEQDGRPYRIAGMNEYMTIGKQEAATWQEGKDSTKVVLRGSAREGRSNGTILLWFADEPGQHECYDWLSYASADTMKTKREDNERIERIYKNQRVNVQSDARKYAEQVETRNHIDVSQASRVPRHQTREQPATDDNIVYEEPEEDAKQQVSARSRMKGDIVKVTSPPITSPHFITETDNRTTRKSTRQSKPVKERTPSPPPAPPRWSEIHELEAWHQPVMYPPTGKSRITIDFQDIERLDEGEFVNDNLVGYALRRVEEEMAPEHKDKVHFFNSFFFTAMMQKNGRKGFNYEGVKKWTKGIDLFSKPYVVVPMCENLHWFVAIICNLPNLERKTALLGDDAADAAETPLTSQKTSVQASPIRDPDEIPDSQEPDKIDKPDEQAMRHLSLDESEGASGPGSEIFEFDDNNNLTGTAALEAQHEEETAQANGKKSRKKSKKRSAPTLKKYPTDKPTIITLDSFGVGHPGQVSTLKKYVEAEAMEKRNMTVAASDIQGMTATGIPVQSNFCDCGLYLVGYVAEFAKDPEAFVNKVLSRQLDQDSDFASFDPSNKRAEIRNELLKLHDEQDRERLALKKAKKDKKFAVTAVTDAQTPAALTASNGLPRARSPLPDPRRNAETRSPVEAVVPIAPEDTAPEGPAQQLSESGPPHLTANDASDDGELLEEQPAKPLVTGGSHRIKAIAPDRAMSPAEPSAQDEDEDSGDEMLDGAANSGNERGSMHKVTSPALDELSQNLFSSVSQGKPTAKNAP